MIGYKQGTRKVTRVCSYTYCMNVFSSYISRNAKFCSQDCAHKSGISRLGKKHSEDTIKRLSILSKNNPKVMATIYTDNYGARAKKI